MVSKLLKGIGRLVLTTGLLCGVSLFLCSSEVKAAAGDPPTVSITYNSSDVDLTRSGDAIELPRFKVTVDNPDTTAITIQQITFLASDNNVIASFSYSDVVVDASGNKEFKISNIDLISKMTPEKISVVGASGIEIYGIGLSYKKDGGSSTPLSPVDVHAAGAKSLPIYEVKPTKRDGYATDVVFPTLTDDTVIFANGNGRPKPSQKYYGYAGEEYTVKSGLTGTNYYEIATLDTAAAPEWDGNSGWKINGSTFGEGEFKIKANSSENVVKFDYLPTIKTIELRDIAAGKTYANGEAINVFVADTDKQKELTLNYIVTPNAAGTNNEAAVKKIPISCSLPDGNKVNLRYASANPIAATPVVSCKLTLGDNSNSILLSNDTAGAALLRLSYDSKGQGTGTQDYNVNIKLNPSALAIANSTEQTPYVFKKDQERKFDIVIVPRAADSDNAVLKNDYELLEIKEENSTSYFPSTSRSYTFDTSRNVGVLTLKSGTTIGNTSITLRLKNKSDATKILAITIPVKISEIDAKTTSDSVNKSDRNFITVGYSLDIRQLILDNLKDSSGNAANQGLTKDNITNVSVGGSTLSDGMWKPTSAVTSAKVTCTVNGTTQIAESSGMTVAAYAAPSATYSDSARTVNVKLPAKISTGYADTDSNIKEVKGFKFVLTDSNGNILAETTDYKEKSDSTGSSGYTVPVDKIEGMVTTAASNGKFSNDTTAVKFKAIPAGLKQADGSSIEEPKTDLYASTDNVTVYKVTASGTNFGTTSAYGLNGQTVTITASPLSGYTFKQWSDGNTSNPRQVKVSSSGTRAFQAVAGDRVNPGTGGTGAGGTGAGGTDNSQLYDDVPKTAESNSAIWLIIFMVFAVMGTSYALYLQLRAATSKNDK